MRILGAIPYLANLFGGHMPTCSIIDHANFKDAEKYCGNTYKYKPCVVSPFSNVHLKVNNRWECFWIGFTSLGKDKEVPSPSGDLEQEH